jgi:hypothetical protein
VKGLYHQNSREISDTIDPVLQGEDSAMGVSFAACGERVSLRAEVGDIVPKISQSVKVREGGEW